MPTERRITAVRAAPGDQVDVELDGRRWRRLPAAAVAAAGLAQGSVLDRPRLRELARARRRAAALQVAARALARRPLSEHELEERLVRRGVAPAARGDVRRTLTSAGYLDDAKVAAGRAALLAERGSGDELIRHDLLGRGISSEAIEEAVAGLAPEAERAREVVRRRGGGAATARWLAARGFDQEAVEAAACAGVADEGGAVVG
jgi:regulatory protein